LAIDRAGRFAAFGTNKENDVDVWDVRSHQRVRTLSSPGSASPQFSDDGSWLVASSPDAYRVWEVRTWREIMTVPRERDDELGIVAFFPGGRVAALTKPRSVVQLVDLASQRVLANLEAAQRPPRLYDVDMSPDGSLIAVAQGNGGVRLWDLALLRRRLMELGLSFDIPLLDAATDKDQRPLEVQIDPG
jgi:WD40 repeat protein